MEGNYWDGLFVLSYACFILSFLLAFIDIAQYWNVVLVLYISTPVCLYLVLNELLITVRGKGIGL
jgi:hypothetical protein